MTRLRLILAVWAARLVALLVPLLRLGSASVLPGQVALAIQPRSLALLCSQLRQGVILVAGTNGKTTTSLLLRAMLEQNGARVVHNATGANLQNGLLTACLRATGLTGRLAADYALFEVDENVLPLILPDTCPRYILCLNLFRDQLDRYGEVDLISQRWQEAIAPLPPDTTVILNADDPTLSYLGSQLPQRVLPFGLHEPESFLAETPHAVDSVYCPRCGARLRYRGVYYSHLGEFTCPICGFARLPLSIASREWPGALPGLYNKYNTLAAIVAARAIGVAPTGIRQAISTFQPAFGRAEELFVAQKRVRILLTKNPAGMNETIRSLGMPPYLAGGPGTTLIVLNDRIPDGTDVSWIWDVDVEPLMEPGAQVVVSGDRAFDMALRLDYARPGPGRGAALLVEPDLPAAVRTALELCPAGRTLHILPTYSAMLEVRALLTGRAIQ